MHREQDQKRALFEQYYRDEYERLKKYAGSKLHNPNMVEELVQETFATAWVKIDDFLASPKPLGWLILTLQNKMKNQKEEITRSRNQCELTEDLSPQHRDQENFLLEYHGMIPDEELQLLYRRYGQDKTNQQIVDELGIKQSAGKMRISRAKEHFKEAFTEEFLK